MNMNEIAAAQLKKDLPSFKAGDTVRVSVKVVEGDNERIQLFDGVVIARRGKGISESFTVRKVSFGVGVERIFPLHSPRIEKIEVLKVGKVRRASIESRQSKKSETQLLKETFRQSGQTAGKSQSGARLPNGARNRNGRKCGHGSDRRNGPRNEVKYLKNKIPRSLKERGIFICAPTLCDGFLTAKSGALSLLKEELLSTGGGIIAKNLSLRAFGKDNCKTRKIKKAPQLYA